VRGTIRRSAADCHMPPLTFWCMTKPSYIDHPVKFLTFQPMATVFDFPVTREAAL
jgi:hypothetical protein